MIHTPRAAGDHASCSAGFSVVVPQEDNVAQTDGSQHPWLEDRGPTLTLLMAVDSATGDVVQSVFHTTEDTRGYLVFLEGMVRQ